MTRYTYPCNDQQQFCVNVPVPGPPPAALQPSDVQTTTSDGIIIEELDDLQDLAYDADIEVRQPDEYDEAESEDEAPVSHRGALPLNEANLAEHFRRLNCDAGCGAGETQYSGGALVRPKVISRKRNRSESAGSISDEGLVPFLDTMPRKKRQARRTEEHLPPQSPSFDDFNNSTSPLEYSPVTTRSAGCNSTPVVFRETQPGLDAVLDSEDLMDIDRE